MNFELVRAVLAFVVLLLVQALVLNNIHLFGCATPLLYVYMILLVRRNYPRWGALLWCFAMGLSVDIFSNTPGVAAASMTTIGLLQPYILKLFIQRDSPDDLQPSMKTLGVGHYFYYTLILVLLYCLLFFTLETFNFFNWLQWLECVGGSVAITVILILVIENFRRK